MWARVTLALTAATLARAQEDSGLSLTSSNAQITFGTGTNTCYLKLENNQLVSNCAIETPSGTISPGTSTTTTQSFELPSSVAVVTATADESGGRRKLTSTPATPNFPSNSDWSSDSSRIYVQDRANQMMSVPNMIMCMVSASGANLKINQGTYVAWVSETACGTSGSSGVEEANSAQTQGSADAVEKYVKMSVTATQEGGTGPLIVGTHVSLPDETQGDCGGGPCGPPARFVYARSVITKGYREAPPNGVWEMEYSIQTPTGNPDFPTFTSIRGYLGVSDDGVQWTETSKFDPSQEPTIDGIVLSGTSADTDEAVGALRGGYGPGTRANMRFGYNGVYFCRESTVHGATSERCFHRSRSMASIATHRYGLYNSDGSRLDTANPSIPIKTSDGKYGQAGYHGIWTESSLSDGDDVKAGANFDLTYTVRKAGAKLRKFTKQSYTLDQIKSVPFNFRPMSEITVNAVTYDKYADYNAIVMVDQSGTVVFKILSTLSCDLQGCMRSYLQGDNTLSVEEMKTLVTYEWAPGQFWFGGLHAWSEALGGPLKIKTECFDPTSLVSDCVISYSSTIVPPGDAGVPPTLKCVRNCFTKDTLSALSSSDDARPYKADTDEADRLADGQEQTYTWDKAEYKLKDDTEQVIGKSALENVDIQPDSEFYHGVRMRLVSESALAGLKCGDDATKYCSSKAEELPEYFEFETGKREWHSAEFLVDGAGQPIAFDPPLRASVVVPQNPSGDADKPFGEYAGAKMTLQYEGFGNLHGFPGRCFDSDTNEPANCGQDAFYQPAFSLPDGTPVTMPDGSTKYVKALESELRFRKASMTSGLASIGLGQLSDLPAPRTVDPYATDLSDPGRPSNSDIYIGPHSPSMFDGLPGVIHGELYEGASTINSTPQSSPGPEL